MDTARRAGKITERHEPLRGKAQWPSGVPREVVFPLGERPFTDYLDHWARTVPDRVAYHFYGRL